jgi:hypothetical protein
MKTESTLNNSCTKENSMKTESTLNNSCTKDDEMMIITTTKFPLCVIRQHIMKRYGGVMVYE